MKDYVVMHLNKEVAEVRGDGTCAVFSDAFMPFDLWLEPGDDMDARVNNLANFNYWCSSRMIRMDRRFAKEMLNSLRLAQAVTDVERARIAISYHALSLTDVYWVKEAGEEVSFDGINLYDHPLTDAFVDVSLRGGSLSAQEAGQLTKQDTAGDLGTQGVAPKAWVRRRGDFYLFKDGEKRDVEAELLASRIADCFDTDHVRYEPDEYEGAMVSASRIITSKERSIATFKNVGIYAANHDRDLYELVLEKDARGFHMMNIVDYLTGNTDRHWENWGFWVDSGSNAIGGLHPLMDFNKAFGSYDTPDGAQCQTTEKRMSQREAAEEAARTIGLGQTREVTRDMFDGYDALDGDALWQMFGRRLALLRAAAEA